jgi:hypothetical protein
VTFLTVAAVQTRGTSGEYALPPAAVGPNASNIPDATVCKVGTAFQQVLQIRKNYGERIQSAASADEQRNLGRQVDEESVQAVVAQGITVDQYDRLIQLALNDRRLGSRLLSSGPLSAR